MSFKMADKISTSLVAVWVLYLYVLDLSEGAKRYTYHFMLFLHIGMTPVIEILLQVR